MKQKVLKTHEPTRGLTSPDRQERIEAKVERMGGWENRPATVPLALLIPEKQAAGKRPIVIGVAQAGKQAFLDHRAGAIAELLDA